MSIDPRDSLLWNSIEGDEPLELQRLLVSGVHAEYHFANGWSPLHHAVDAESDFNSQVGKPLDLRLIAPLLESGADVNALYELVDGWQTPLDIAYLYQNHRAIDALTQAGGLRGDRLHGESVARVERPSKGAQIAAVLGPDIFRWAIELLPEGVEIDNVRYRDLIDVSEDEVFDFVVEHGFDPRVVSADVVRDDRICVVQAGIDWRVFYTERGLVTDDATYARREDADREIVRRLVRLARIMLNSRYWHAHGLPFPCSED